MNMKGLSKEKVMKQISNIIQNAYLFLGYIEFANYIIKKSAVEEEDPKKQKSMMIQKLKKHFFARTVARNLLNGMVNVLIATNGILLLKKW